MWPTERGEVPSGSAEAVSAPLNPVVPLSMLFGAPQSPPPTPEVPPDETPLTLENGIVCSPDQTRAAHLILAAIRQWAQGNAREASVLTLAGSAGSGKSTIVRGMARALRAEGYNVEFVAPTGKAALRLRQLSGEIVVTLHQRFLGAPKELCLCPYCRKAAEEFSAILEAGENHTCPNCKAAVAANTHFETRLVFPEKRYDATEMEANRSVIFCDEASMVSAKIGQQIRAAMSKQQVLVYVGDDKQLPPISDEGDREEEDSKADPWAADFRNPTARLSTIHRQVAGHPILATANRIAGDVEAGRLSWPSNAYVKSPGRLDTVWDCSYEVPALWLATRRQAGAEATLVTWTHRDRDALNAAVRRIRGLEAAAESRGVPVVQGDYLLVKVNSGGYLNGEVVQVLQDAQWIGKDLSTRYESYPILSVLVTAPLAFGPQAQPRTVWILPDLLTVKGQRQYRTALSGARKRLEDLYAEWEDGESLRARGSERPVALRAYQTFEQYVIGTLGYHPDFLLHVWWGECLTCHAAQGSEWEQVGVVNARGFLGRWKADVPWSRRWLYTAITRARTSLSIFDLAKIT